MAKYVKYKGEVYKRLGDDEGSYSSGGGPSCLSILLLPFKALFFLYIALWVALFGFSILVTTVPSLRDGYMRWAEQQMEKSMRSVEELQNRSASAQFGRTATVTANAAN